jgi:hypothetical protein
MLARSHPAKGLGADPLQPEGTEKGEPEDNGEDGDEQADPPVRQPAAQRARLGVMST